MEVPRKEEVNLYKFDELSKEAKERAIKDWQEDGYGWDDHDSEFLTEDFKERLREKGFYDNVEVYWSLGYCQGDGVCFKGSINPSVFFKENKIIGYSELRKYDISILVETSHQECHWNSMHVTVEANWGSWEDLVPKDLWEEWQDWEVEQTAIRRRYTEEIRKVDEARQAPIKEWEHLMESLKGRTGVLDWTPDLPEKPGLLDIPYPPEPDYGEKPRRFVRAEETAKRKEERLNLKVKELEEELQEWVKDMSRELEKSGYEEMEYRGSTEAATEYFENNDWEFTKDGERWS